MSVQCLIHPLEVIKIHQQCSSNADTIYRTALKIYTNEGISAFYKGIVPELISKSIKQAWCWPMITGIPPWLEKEYQLKPLHQQGITGFCIASFDAAVTTPLMRIKITSILKEKKKIPLKDIFKEGWHGFGSHWSKLSANWISFLVTQKYFRDRFQEKSNQPLSIPELMTIGIQTAFVVSIIAPFDVANSLQNKD